MRSRTGTTVLTALPVPRRTGSIETSLMHAAREVLDIGKFVFLRVYGPKQSLGPQTSQKRYDATTCMASSSHL